MGREPELEFSEGAHVQARCVPRLVKCTLRGPPHPVWSCNHIYPIYQYLNHQDRQQADCTDAPKRPPATLIVHDMRDAYLTSACQIWKQ